MSSLFGSVSIALRSMMAQQAAISVTANNVSNINTEGYSRQRAELIEADAVFDGSHMVGTGVKLEQITSLRDRVLQLRIQDERHQQGSLQAQVTSLQDIETLFSSDTSNLGDSINKFFNSVSDLSTNASSVPLRQSVLMSARNLANIFRSSAATLQQRQFSLDLDIQQSTSEVNEITAQIAELNHKIAFNSGTAAEMGSFEDRRDLLLQNLSSLIGTQVIKSDDGLTVTMKNGTALVLGDKATPLTIARQGDGSVRIMSDGQDVTNQMAGGKLSGLLTVREQVIPALLADLDTLAGSIANAVNTAHRNGADLDGNAGTDFFAPPSAGNKGAAAALQVNLSDPRQIAASSDGSAGSNGNLNSILDLRNRAIVQGDTPIDFYAKVAFQLGSQLSNAKSELDASELVSEQLSDQRGSISGVSLDEEAADLIRYQRAYEAAARVLSVISDLTELSVNLGRS